MTFYLGTHQPAWLARDLGVPLLVSHRRLAGRASLPRATGPWACDSGGFTELSLHGRWRTTELAPELPIIPVLQGQSISDYHRCADLYEKHGIDLAALLLVGVGSVCRRQHTIEVEHIVRSLAARNLRLHTFGAKILGLSRFADVIASSDSASWSRRGRYVPGCSPSHATESNCPRFALDWYSRLPTSPTDEPGQHSARPEGSRRATMGAPRGGATQRRAA
ncbi:deazapurine DNA modification protein DpdA family protein [Actinokineospora sp.]|uniref:deazapurine DNA modification protein DpdA family protein n=1 Tax=Actinokineospora sp. TaxID=1872133 RepID=UPI0040382FCB